MGVSAESDAPADLTPETFPATHYTVGWVGPQGDRDGCGEKKKSVAKTEFELRTARFLTIFL